jgi:integrase
MALLPSEQDRLTQCATGPCCLPVFLDVAAATGARRGEVLALRWSDVKGMLVFIDRSLCQTRDGLVFKSTKDGGVAQSGVAAVDGGLPRGASTAPG